MQKPNSTMATILATLFPNSQKPVSEKLEAEEFNQFAADATEIDARLATQKEGNEKLQQDFAAEQAKVVALEAEKAAWAAKETDLQASITQLTESNKQLQGWFDAEKAKGIALPKTDKTGASAPVELTHSAQVAMSILFNK